MFSVVIPTYKRDDDLEACLKSIRENTSYDVEIIVPCSCDDSTVAVCEKYGAKAVADNARKNGKRIKSLWAILNDGIKMAANDLVLYLNDDCLVLPEWDKIAEKYFSDGETGLLVLKTKGIGQHPEFRVIPAKYDFPCANYAIINRRAEIFFDERYDWFYGDADLPLQFAFKSALKIKTTTENMVIHNHRIDEERNVHEGHIDESNPDEDSFELKWCGFKRIGDRLVEKNLLKRFLLKMKIHLKNMLRKK